MKWYDYLAAIFFADVISSLLLGFLFSPNFIISIVIGLLLTFTWEGWKMYERFRVNANRI